MEFSIGSKKKLRKGPSGIKQLFVESQKNGERDFGFDLR